MVEQKESGRAAFRVFCPQAERVEIVGTFTGWHDQPIAMWRDASGWWTAALDLEPGDHEFQYLIDRREWRPDYAAGGLRLNEFGTWVSQLTVRTPEVQVRPVATVTPATTQTQTPARAHAHAA